VGSFFPGIENFENTVHTNQFKKDPYLFGHATKLEVSILIVEPSQARQDSSQTRAIDKTQVAEIKYDLSVCINYRRDIPFEFLGVASVQVFSGQGDNRDIIQHFHGYFHFVPLSKFLEA